MNGQTELYDPGRAGSEGGPRPNHITCAGLLAFPPPLQCNTLRIISTRPSYWGVHHPLSAIFSISSTAFCTYSLGSHDTLRHCQRARACRCGGEKSRALRQGRVFQLLVRMALWHSGFWDGPAFRTRVICRGLQNHHVL